MAFASRLGQSQRAGTAGLLEWGDTADTRPATAGSRDLRSSNAFANGSNQNCGNVLTDRPSTRVHAAPGGYSQVGALISGCAVDDRSDLRSSNAFANGANQNCGNVLTDRPTTRLHAPPGGGSRQVSDLLNWGE